MGPIVAVCGDAGGAAALAPVVEALLARGVRLRTEAYGPGADLWRERGLRVESLSMPASEAEAVDSLRRDGAQLLLAATSLNGQMIEARLLRAARAAGMPSIAVLDWWSNYTPRFSVDEPRDAAPDRIAIMDKRARDEMVADGFDPRALVITGQPAFDVLGARRKGFNTAARTSQRAAWGAGDSDRVVLFVSQPISVMAADYGAAAQALGYEERGVLAHLVASLERIAAHTGGPVTLVLRSHPREDSTWMRAVRAQRVHVVVSNHGDARAAVLAADLVTGMNSVLLMEAVYLGRPVISIQPGLRTPDTLPTNASGLSVPVYDAGGLDTSLAAMLDGGAVFQAHMARVRSACQSADATARVIELIISLSEDSNAWHG